MGNEIEEALRQMLDTKTLRVEELERELLAVQEERDLMKRALNRRQDQASAQLTKTFTTIFKIAGKSEYVALSEEQELITVMFRAMLKKIDADRAWDKNETVNRFTSWEHIW